MEQVGGVVKAFSMPLISVVEYARKKKEASQKGGATATAAPIMSYDVTISYVASIIFMILAGYLCWKCNVSEYFLSHLLLHLPSPDG
jgi:hypothetical protein